MSVWTGGIVLLFSDVRYGEMVGFQGVDLLTLGSQMLSSLYLNRHM